MTWDSFYEKFFDWSESTQKARLSTLENFGDPDEVVEIAWEYAQDQKLVSRFISNAVDAGVKFSTENIMDILYELSPDVQSKLVLFSQATFNSEQLEELLYEIDKKTMEQLYQRALGEGLVNNSTKELFIIEGVIPEEEPIEKIRGQRKKNKEDFWQGVAEFELIDDTIDLFFGKGKHKK